MNFSWYSIDRVLVPKKADWYITVWIVAITALVLALLFNNLIVALLIFIGTVALTLNARREPKEVSIRITERGIQKDDLFFPWSSFISFWIEEEDVMPKLLLEPQRRYLPHNVIIINTTEVDIEELREAISTKLEEYEQHEPALERIFERLGF